jgi:hypothetical protein
MRTIIIVTTALALAGCGAIRNAVSPAPSTTTAMQAGPSEPAARGTVAATQGENGNTEIDINVQHLSEPQKAAPSARTYVVWAQPREANLPVQNLGALQVDRDLNGHLRATTPLKDFDVIVIAEPTPIEAKPSTHRVMSATVQSSAMGAPSR